MNPTITANVGTAAQGQIGSAIARASARSGVDFNYLYGQARAESGLNPNARAGSSSATGLYQFLDQTWLGMVERHGAANGMGWASEAIQRNANGRLTVSDPTVRQQILDLRRDPDAAASMAAAYASDNREHLETQLGRPMDNVDLYMAHFLGAGGATRFLRAAGASPDAPAAASFPAEARANRSIFYDRSGAPRSFTEVRSEMGRRLGLGDTPAPTAFAQSAPGSTTDFDAMTAALLGEEDSSAARMNLLANANMMPGITPSAINARLAYMTLAQLDGSASDLGSLS